MSKYRVIPEISLLKVGHAIFAEVNGVHCRASGVDSGTNNVIFFLFVFESSME